MWRDFQFLRNHLGCLRGRCRCAAVAARTAPYGLNAQVSSIVLQRVLVLCAMSIT
jgi:hypothetical protein